MRSRLGRLQRLPIATHDAPQEHACPDQGHQAQPEKNGLGQTHGDRSPPETPSRNTASVIAPDDIRTVGASARGVAAANDSRIFRERTDSK